MPYLPKDEFDKGKYDPEFKSKTTIAKELFGEALEKGIKFSAATFDSWYASSEFIEYINSKDKTFYSDDFIPTVSNGFGTCELIKTSIHNKEN